MFKKKNPPVAAEGAVVNASTSKKSQRPPVKEAEEPPSRKSEPRGKSSSKKHANAAKILKKAAPPKSSLDVIAYYRMIEDGICEVEPGLFSKSLRFSDINYQTARRDDQVDMFSLYCELLNYFDPSVHIQITLINRHIDEEEFRQSMLIPLIGDDDPLDDYRQEINTLLSTKALEGQNSIIHDKYITISTTATSYESAIQSLSRLEADLDENLKSLNSNSASLSGRERLAILHDTFHPNDRFTFQYRDLVGSGLTTKSAVAPAAFSFPDMKPYFGFDNHFGQVVFVRDLPPDLGDRLMTSLTDLPFNLQLSLHITPVDQTEALELVRRQLGFMEMEATGKADAAVEKGRSPTLAIPMETRRSYEEGQKLLNQLENQNQRMFRVALLAYTYSDDLDTLQTQIDQIMSAARKCNVKIDVLPLQQREAINSILPLGKNFLGLERNLTTASTAIFVPFTTQELYQPGGKFYGQNAMSHNMIIADRTLLMTPSGMVLGTPGSGKSMIGKQEMEFVLCGERDSEVIVLDPEGEVRHEVA